MFRSVLLACAVLLFAAPAGAGPPDVLVKRLTEAYRQTSTLSATFTQETRFAGFSTARTFAGTVEIRRPDRMRWDYTEHSKQQLFVNGWELTVYDPKNRQAIVSKLSPSSDRQLPLHLLADVTGVDKTYHVAAGDGPTELVLTPKEPHPQAPEKIHLWLDPKTGLIARVKLYLPGGSISDITFSDTASNVAIEDKRFVFSPPPGTYMVDPKKMLPGSR